MIQYQNPHTCIFESALFRTTSTVIQTPDLVLMVDPNWLPREVADIQTYVRNIRRERPLYVLYTHSDYDHIIGSGAFPAATVIASHALAHHPNKVAQLQRTLAWDEARYIRRDYAITYPEVDIVAAQDAQQLAIGSTNLTFYLAPGHTSDGLFTIVEFADQRIFIAGDYVSNIEFPFIYHSSYEYEQTLEKARQIIDNQNLTLLIPGHGDATSNKIDMLDRVQESEAYIQSLRTAIEQGQAFPEAKLWQRYAFPAGMRKEHEENMALVRKELDIAS